MSLRSRAGALIYDWPRFELALRGLGRYASHPTPWVLMRNRSEAIAGDGRGVRCDWNWTSELHIANVFPSAAVRLMRRALRDWPIVLRDDPAASGPARVSFVIGHRGVDRLPHLLATLRSIAGQTIAVETIVIEQSARREIETSLPAWVRYIHSPVPRPGYPYNRSWTLNVGARAARGDLLILHDNDMLSPAAYAAEALARMEEGFSFLELKRFTFYLPEKETGRFFASGRLPDGAPATVVQNLQGASIAAARGAFFDIGGYDEAFVGWGGEDNDFWDRANAAGRVYAFGYLPFVHLHHRAQEGKLQGREAPAVRRYHDEIAGIPPRERIERLRAKPNGRVEGPADR